MFSSATLRHCILVGLLLLVGAASTVSGQETTTTPAPLNGRDGRDLALDQFRPQPTLKVAEHLLTRAKFPCVDIHLHPFAKLRGWRGRAAFLVCLAPVVLGFMLPVGLLVHTSWRHAGVILAGSFWSAAWHSLVLAALAATLAVAPLFTSFSYLATVNPPLACFSALAGLAALGVQRRGTRADCLRAGLTTGLALGIKYVAFPVALLTPLAHWLRPREQGGAPRWRRSRFMARWRAVSAWSGWRVSSNN